MKLELDDELIEALTSIKEWGEYFTEDEYQAWNNLIAEKHAQGKDDFLKKVLGITYETYIGDTISQAAKSIGLTDKDYTKRVAFMLYKEDTLKMYGDEVVTEPLNYISVNDEDIISSYFLTI